MKKLILKHALANALEYGGRADIQAVLGRVLSEKPALKNKIKQIAKEVKMIVDEVNSWELEKQQAEYKKFGIKEKKKIVKPKYELPELPNAKKGKVITAFPPEPSKHPHIGHAKSALINYLYAQKYKGKIILRFEDTNPELIKGEFYDAFIDNLKWLGLKWNKIDYISNHIPKYYEATERLLKENKAYVCKCKQETIKILRREMKACEHREQSTNENLNLWNDMLKKLKEGEASVRLKISMEHQNPNMRDPTIMRIIEHPHHRTKSKYRVWPMYDFGTALMDGWEKITHRVRSKEFEMRTELQQFIQKSLGMKSPHIMEIARFNLQGVPSSGRIIREMISKGELLGWDDPRLTTLIALRKRGFHPEGIKNFLVATGVSKTESMLTWDMLESYNRSIIDPIANRYFMVTDSVEIKVEAAPSIDFVEELLHPEFPNRGKRKIPVNVNRIFIEKKDFEKLRGMKIRLIGLFNLMLAEEAKFVSQEVDTETQKIQWVSENSVPIKIVMNDGSVVKAIAEPEVVKLKKDSIIQFVRFGFCRVDQIKPELVFYFTHK